MKSLLSPSLIIFLAVAANGCRSSTLPFGVAADPSDALDATTPTELGRAAEQLSRQLQAESDPVRRVRMVRDIAKLKGADAINCLRVALQDPRAEVRVAACRGLTKQGNIAARDLLAETLASDTNIDVRIAATRALGEFKGPATVGALAVAIDDADPALQYRAVQSLRSASEQDFGNDLGKWRQFARAQLENSLNAIATEPEQASLR